MKLLVFRHDGELCVFVQRHRIVRKVGTADLIELQEIAVSGDIGNQTCCVHCVLVANNGARDASDGLRDKHVGCWYVTNRMHH